MNGSGTIWTSVLEQFERHAPASVMARVALEHALPSEWIDVVFEEHRQRQYSHEGKVPCTPTTARRGMAPAPRVGRPIISRHLAPLPSRPPARSVPAPPLAAVRRPPPPASASSRHAHVAPPTHLGVHRASGPPGPR